MLTRRAMARMKWSLAGICILTLRAVCQGTTSMPSSTASTGILSLAPTSTVITPFAGQRTCNNSPLLCGRPYDNVTQLGAHDSPVTISLLQSDAVSDFADQAWSWQKQLDSGVRLMSAEIFYDGSRAGLDVWRVCHANCNAADVGSLSYWLDFIKNWLTQNPNNVITLLLANAPSNAATWTVMSQVYQSVGVDSMSYKPPSDQTPPENGWPSLERLIDLRSPLLTFIDTIADAPGDTLGSAPYIMQASNFMFSTEWKTKDPNNFTTCTMGTENVGADAGDASFQKVLTSKLIPLMSHVLYWEATVVAPWDDGTTLTVDTSNGAMAAQINGNTTAGVGNLEDHANACASQWDRYPTFVLCDFVDQGTAMDVVNMMNGVSTAAQISSLGQTSTALVVPTNTSVPVVVAAAELANKPTQQNVCSNSRPSWQVQLLAALVCIVTATLSTP